ncbi:MAG: hypothetical protein P8Y92_13140 [Halioglobus sp.]
MGELVVTCVAAHEGEALDEESVRDFAREKLNGYKVPRHVLFLSAGDFQLTGNAKIKTADLRDLPVQGLAFE